MKLHESISFPIENPIMNLVEIIKNMVIKKKKKSICMLLEYNKGRDIC